MHCCIEQALPASLGGLAIPRVFFDVGNHPRIEDPLPIACGIKATIEIDIGASEVQTDLFGHLLQGVQPLRQQDHVRLIDGSHWEGRQHIAVVVSHSDDLLSLLVLIARVANPIAPFLATVLVPSPCSTLRSSFCASARCPTLATNAFSSEPSSAHFAKAR